MEDFKEIVFDGLWPQLDAHDLPVFAEKCRRLELAVAIHPERSHLMTFGTPDDIRKMIKVYDDTFDPLNGGAWYYIEIDNGFPYENIVALVEAVQELRN